MEKHTERRDSNENKDAIGTTRKAVDLDITFFDTAEVYSYGQNEDLIGEVLRLVRNAGLGDIGTSGFAVQQSGNHP